MTSAYRIPHTHYLLYEWDEMRTSVTPRKLGYPIWMWRISPKQVETVPYSGLPVLRVTSEKFGRISTWRDYSDPVLPRRVPGTARSYGKPYALINSTEAWGESSSCTKTPRFNSVYARKWSSSISVFHYQSIAIVCAKGNDDDCD